MTEALKVTGLHFAYRGKQVLQDVSFSIKAGAFCALLGPNGAGKSTIFGLLTRLLAAEPGQIFVDGQDVTRAASATLSQIGVVFQKPPLDLDMSVERNMRYFAGLHGISGALARARIDAALDRLSVADRRHDKVRILNGGHRRRVEIARALISNPKLLLLDEPTVGLDAESRQGVTEHVHALAQDGVSVLWATHLVDEIGPRDQVVVLHKGQVLANASGQELAGDRPLLDVFLDMTGRSPDRAQA